TLLSPAFGTQVGVELRQPLLRGLGLDDARLALRVASTGRRAAVASLRRTVSETVAAVEKAYWDLVAARQGVGVREDAVRLAEQDQWLESIAPSDSAVVSVTPVDHARALRRALASRPELAEAEAAVERRHAETARAWSGVLPALDAVVSYDRFGLAGVRNPAG